MEITFKEYKISWEPIGTEGIPPIPESLQPKIEELYWEIQNPKPRTTEKLRRFIKKYPRVVQLKNYLSSVYMLLGKEEESFEINDNILKQYPDYLFAKINKANQYVESEDYLKIEELLGKGFDLKELYPQREVFHVSEFMSMQLIAVRYYLGLNDFEQADKRMEVMEEVDKDTYQCEQAKRFYSKAIRERIQKRFEQEEKLNIIPTNTFNQNKRAFNLPDFHADIIYELYGYDFDIPPKVIHQILNLDRQKAIEDLENILKDSYLNFDKDRSEEFTSAPFHAFYLLSELEAEESLPVILEMLQQNKDYFDQVWNGELTETDWIPLVRLGKNRIPLLENYLQLPGTFTDFRTLVIDALEQIFYHFSEKKDEILDVFKSLLNFITQAKIEDNVIDSEFNGILVWTLLNMKATQFLPQVRTLYEREIINPGICGPYKEVEEVMLKRDTSSFKKNFLGIEEIYDDFLNDEEEYQSKPDWDKVFNYEDKQEKIQSSPKIGRNDPCPCGSGKKFKKCCIGKGIYD